jgi:hypothetical protein
MDRATIVVLIATPVLLACAAPPICAHESSMWGLCLPEAEAPDHILGCAPTIASTLDPSTSSRRCLTVEQLTDPASQITDGFVRLCGADVENPSPLIAETPSLTSRCASNTEDSGAGLPSAIGCVQKSQEASECLNCCQSGSSHDFWLREEYVGWFAEVGRVPTLVATTPDLASSIVKPLYGDAVYNGDYRSGTWTEIGMWLDCGHTRGIQMDYFFVGQSSSPFFASSDGDPILVRPFTDAITGLPAVQLIAAPGIVVGSISIDNHNSFDGAGIDLRRNLWNCSCNQCCGGMDQRDGWCGENINRLDVIYGFRYYGFNDNLEINERLTSIDGGSSVPIGTQIDVRDRFVTQSNFYGLELGVIHQRYVHKWMAEGTVKVDLGDMNQLVAINGSTTVSFPGQPTVINQGGLLALSSNIGDHMHDRFVAIPEFSLRIGYRATERLTFLAGYSLLYVDQIVRAGNQIDTRINPNLIPPVIGGGPNRPLVPFHRSDLMVQGITLGAEYRFW